MGWKTTFLKDRWTSAQLSCTYLGKIHVSVISDWSEIMSLKSDQFETLFSVLNFEVKCVCFFFFSKKGFVGVCNCSMFCCTLRYVHSSFVIILLGKRELVALLSLSSWCLVIVEWLFLVVPWVCLQFVIVVLPDHTHLLFLFAVYWYSHCGSL